MAFVDSSTVGPMCRQHPGDFVPTHRVKAVATRRRPLRLPMAARLTFASGAAVVAAPRLDLPPLRQTGSGTSKCRSSSGALKTTCWFRRRTMQSRTACLAAGAGVSRRFRCRPLRLPGALQQRTCVDRALHLTSAAGFDQAAFREVQRGGRYFFHRTLKSGAGSSRSMGPRWALARLRFYGIPLRNAV